MNEAIVLCILSDGACCVGKECPLYKKCFEEADDYFTHPL